MTSIGRPGEDRKYTATDKAYLKKTAKKRAERNKDRRELLKAGAKLSSKVKGSTKSKKGCKTEAGHTTDFKDGGSKKLQLKHNALKKTEVGAKVKELKRKRNCRESIMPPNELEWDEESVPQEVALIQALDAEVGDSIILVYSNASDQLISGLVVTETSDKVITQLKRITDESDCYYLRLQLTEVYVSGSKH